MLQPDERCATGQGKGLEKRTVRCWAVLQVLYLLQKVFWMCVCEGDKERVSACEHSVMVGMHSTAAALAHSKKKNRSQNFTQLFPWDTTFESKM